MPFPKSVREEALIRSKRHCCICEEFCGRATDVHHIIQEAVGGPNTLDNAVVLCLRCHSEVGHYNPLHPIGNKYSINEVRERRDKWWEWCRNNSGKTPPKSPILVAPEEIPIQSGDWASHASIQMYSVSERPYFAVVLRVGIPKGLEFNTDVILDMPRPDELPSLEMIGLGVQPSIFGLFGKDRFGQPTVWWYFYRLNARAAVAMNIRCNVQKSLAEGACVTASVASFSDSPPKMGSKPDGTGVFVGFEAIEEGMVIEGMIQWMNRQATP